MTDVKIKNDAIFPLNQAIEGENNDKSEEYDHVSGKGTAWRIVNEPSRRKFDRSTYMIF